MGPETHLYTLLMCETSRKLFLSLANEQILMAKHLLLLVNPSDPEALLTYTAELVRDGIVTQQQLDTHLERILRAKNKIIKLGRYVPLELLR